MAMTPEQRRLQARLAAQSRWARLSSAERSAATAAARSAFEDRLAAAPNPEAARAAHMTRMALAASRKRTA